MGLVGCWQGYDMHKVSLAQERHQKLTVFIDF